jgi:predicted DNA binding CopG/RHH family protein
MKKPIVKTQNDIPKNMTEQQARAYWDSHSITPSLLAEPLESDLQAKLKVARAERSSRNISVNVANELEQRLRHVANLKKVPYQTLLKEFVLERLYEEEKRLGIV